MALFSESMPQCCRKELDTADIVRDAIFSEATIASEEPTNRKGGKTTLQMMTPGLEGAGETPASAYLLVSTMGIWVDSCKLIRRSMRRSIWYHNAVFFGEITFSNTGTYFMRNAMSCCSTSVDLLM